MKIDKLFLVLLLALSTHLIYQTSLSLYYRSQSSVKEGLHKQCGDKEICNEKTSDVKSPEMSTPPLPPLLDSCWMPAFIAQNSNPGFFIAQTPVLLHKTAISCSSFPISVIKQIKTYFLISVAQTASSPLQTLVHTSLDPSWDQLSPNWCCNIHVLLQFASNIHALSVCFNLQIQCPVQLLHFLIPSHEEEFNTSSQSRSHEEMQE